MNNEARQEAQGAQEDKDWETVKQIKALPSNPGMAILLLARGTFRDPFERVARIRKY